MNILHRFAAKVAQVSQVSKVFSKSGLGKLHLRQPSLHGRITTVFLISFLTFVTISGSALLIVFNYQVGRYTEFVGSQYALQFARVLEAYYNGKDSWDDVGEWLHQNFAPQENLSAEQVEKNAAEQLVAQSKPRGKPQDVPVVQQRNRQGDAQAQARGKRKKELTDKDAPLRDAPLEVGFSPYFEPRIRFYPPGTPNGIIDNNIYTRFFYPKEKDQELFFFHRNAPNLSARSSLRSLPGSPTREHFSSAPNFNFYFLAEPGSGNLVVSDKMLGKKYLDSALLSFCLIDPFCSLGESTTLLKGNDYIGQRSKDLDAQFDLWFQTFFGKESRTGGKRSRLNKQSLQKFLREEGFASWVSSEDRPDLFASEQPEGFFTRLPLRYIRAQDRERQMFVLLDTKGKFITGNLAKEALVEKLGSTWNRLEKYIASYDKGQPSKGQSRLKTETSFFSFGPSFAKNIFAIRGQDEQPVGFLYAESIVSPVWKTINREVNSVILRVVLFSSLVIALLYWFIGRYYLSKLFVPLRSLSHVASEVRRGNTRARMQQLPKEAELALVTEQFNQMLDSLAHEETLREQQCRDVAHELRTPITIISGELQLIEEGVYRADEDRIKGLLSQVQQMQRLVNDLDILYNVDAGKSKKSTLEFVDLDAAGLLHHAHSAFQTQMQQKGIRFTLRLDFPSDSSEKVVCVQGNASRLHQVFSNFLVNAMRYTPRGGHIEIAGSVMQNGPKLAGEHLIFSVADTGCGIPEEKRAFVFERFFRVDDDRNHQSGGSGLGLAISKNFVELHNGFIWVEESDLEKDAKGAKFCFALPRA